ncbi:AraC family transcriptional regulator [Suipraeoptans intestinalis]|uniref:AraC family transcriptional regulator n=1 Tax=Suipraeoptans intestinalis TaxID=2606628 RepID=UPI0023F38E5F|nr:AraC family transcriptional regulator [Suipraeoptans intestinalis]
MSDFDDIKFSFLYIDLYSMGKEWFYPESKVPYNMLRYIVRGEAEFFINGEKIHVKQNDIVYIPWGCKMSCRAVSGNFEFYSVRFITSVFWEDKDVLKEYYGLQRITQAQGEEKYFEEIYKWVKTKHVAKKSFIRGYLYVLIASLSVRGIPEHVERRREDAKECDLDKILLRESKCNKMDSRVRIVTDYIILHPEEKFTPEKMARMVGLSKQRFSTLFKDNTGKSPMEYAKEIKLTTAARKLLVSTESISEIAYDVGYEDPNYFIREFKKAFGYTPNRYRVGAKEF